MKKRALFLTSVMLFGGLQASAALAQSTTGTWIPSGQNSQPVSPSNGETIGAGDRVQAELDARRFAAFRAAHPEMSYSEAFYSFPWGGNPLP